MSARIRHRNLTLPESSIARIAAIRELTEATSDSEVIRRAMRVYENLLQAGAIVQDKDGKNLPAGKSRMAETAAPGAPHALPKGDSTQ